MSEETFVETYWRARADRNAKEAERYKAMADELAKALDVYANEWEWSICDAESDPWRLLFDSSTQDGHGYETARIALKKYDAMKGEE